MHNIKEIRENPDKFQENLKKRYVDIDVKKIISLDENNRKLIQQKENLEKEKKIFLNLKINLYLKNLKKFQKKYHNIQKNNLK